MKGMIIIQADKCVGCKSCELACAVEHSECKELFRTIQETPAPAARLEVPPNKKFVICRHCKKALCIDACEPKALYREDLDSPVMVDNELCVGCKSCVTACPFGAIRYDDKDEVIIKCDQCFERLARDELPACVTACPTSALEFEPFDEENESKRKAFLVQVKGIKREK